MDCPLCLSDKTHLFVAAHGRDFWRCAVCALTFVDPQHFLAAEEELSRYAHHENDPTDERYRSGWRR